MSKNSQFIKIIVAVLLLIGVATTVSWSFWKQELKYQLPTPVPQDFKAIKQNTFIDDKHLSGLTGKPILLHFFNPECPCSKFNSKHVNDLMVKYKDSLNFILIVPNGCDTTLIRSFFPSDNRIVLDINQQLAKKCGVYSTPQAVILTKKHLLWYCGNYNKSRYCTSKATNYAEQAIIQLLQNNSKYQSLAVKAYGCSIFNIEQ